MTPPSHYQTSLSGPTGLTITVSPFILLFLYWLFKGGTKIELGASWIHGILGNPLYELAVSHNLVEVAQAQVLLSIELGGVKYLLMTDT